MQNDHKGRIAHDICGHTLESFYASGQRGPEVRADGRGGSLARGYYAAHAGETVGPFNTRNAALDAGIASLNEHVNGPRDAEPTPAESAAIDTLAEWGRADAGNAGETGADVPGPDLTDAQNRVLESIGDEWTPVSNIARPNIAGTLDSLERAGLIEQEKAYLANASNGRLWRVRRLPSNVPGDRGEHPGADVEREKRERIQTYRTRRTYTNAPADTAGPVNVNPADVLGFREFWNDYLTPDAFAADMGISKPEALALIERGRAAHDYGAPHAKTAKALNRDVVLAGGTPYARPVALLYRPAGYRPAGSRSIWRDATLATRWTVDGTPYGQEYPLKGGGAYGATRAALDYVRRTRDVWAPGDESGRTFAGIGFGLLGWIEWAPDPRPGVESGVDGRPAYLIIGERARDGLLVTLAFEGDSVSRVDVRPDEYRPAMPPRHIAREHSGA
mgnify:CR=1 FL=1